MPNPRHSVKSTTDHKPQGASTAAKDPTIKAKKDEPPVEITPLEKMLQNAGPVRTDGTDKFFGLENVRRRLGGPSAQTCC